MTNCPTCQKPVDPLRAPAVGVRDGKVISYCSKECAAAAESRPVMTPAKEITKPVAKVKPPKRTPASGVAQPSALLDSGPVIEIIHEPASGVVTSAADARSGRASAVARSETNGAIQIADTGRVDDYVDFEEPRRGRTTLIVLLVLLVLAGGAFAAYQLGYLDELLHHHTASAATAPAPAPVVKEPAPAPVKVATPAEAVESARSLLRAQLHSDSPRVQRVAATALARTGDPEAIAALVAALAKETSDIAKLDIDYSLARAGDKRGAEALVAALAAPRRDVKAEAARGLALLGDKRAIPTLLEFLGISQFRLGAAEQLAYLAEPHALDVLDKVRKDPTASADDRARAAIALGIGGRTEVTDALRTLLDDARFNAFAASSLASLHDASARPVLVKHLDIPSLRVGAARALRRLDPALDPAPLLPPLLAALAGSKDTDQVQAAEAVLLLAGPAEWSAHE